ncbi:RidA family protein [Flavobacterium album]|uniref:RidA family protein n=1 Tax=Flavobacterium album TaxID=2175091 RepID=A0A2S1QVA9_9FLAO|nr:RidA family protein [Flavobacterium album]AWH84314.1 RidA family protein [Flavobacterium album]
MDITLTNPWQWQDSLGYSQAVEVKNNTRTLYCAGQAAVDANGQPSGEGMRAQIKLALQNLEQVIEKAGYTPKGIVRLNYYTTSIPEFFAAYDIITSWVLQHGIQPASTLIEIKALAFPQLLVEIEATVSG